MQPPPKPCIHCIKPPLHKAYPYRKIHLHLDSEDDGVKEENEGFPNLKRFCFGPLKSFEDASDEGVLGELDNLAVQLVVVRLDDNIIVGLDGKVVNIAG